MTQQIYNIDLVWTCNKQRLCY